MWVTLYSTARGSPHSIVTATSITARSSASCVCVCSNVAGHKTSKSAPCSPTTLLDLCVCAVCNFGHAFLCFFRGPPKGSSLKLFLFLFVYKFCSSSGICAQSPTRSHFALHFSICASLPRPEAHQRPSEFIYGFERIDTSLCSVEPHEAETSCKFQALAHKINIACVKRRSSKLTRCNGSGREL